MNDFYVGYLPKAPTALAGFVRRVIVVLGLLVVTAALMLVVGQMPFANSAFEYGKLRSFEGVVVAQPFPTLLVARPGEIGQQDKYSRYLLVAPGKHGADDLVAGFDGKQVRLQGQLIYREGGTMVEIAPSSIAVIEYCAYSSRDHSRSGNRDGYRRNRRQQVLPGRDESRPREGSPRLRGTLSEWGDSADLYYD